MSASNPQILHRMVAFLERVRSLETSDFDDYIHNRLLLQRKRDGDNCTPAFPILGPNKPALGLDDAFTDG